MHIRLDHISKRFGREWIFRDVSLNLQQGEWYALLGSNGSGKSTLLQLILGSGTASKGSITYTYQNKEIDPEEFFSYCSFSAPYLEVVEEFTLHELLTFHFNLKPAKQGMNANTVIAELGLEKHASKFIHTFSSGMKQRVKLGLSIFCDTPVLLLDEPCTNLDAQGVNWYRAALQKHCSNQLLVVASNQPEEYDMCPNIIELQHYKP